MANKYQVVDEILKVQGEGTYNVTFTNLNITDTENTESVEVIGAITEAVKDNLNLTYSDITDAPELPIDTNNESPAYETVSGDRKIKGFKEVAFTGSYESLLDAPGIPVAGYDNGQVKDFDPIAFTGITDLGNVQVSAMLDLRSYSGGVDTLGQDSAYIDTLPAGLANALGSFYDNFSQNKGKKPFFVITNAVASGKVFSVLQVDKIGPGGADGYYYYKIDVTNINSSTYPFVVGTEGSSVLDNIEITSQLGCFIFDLVNNCIYYKSADVNANIELPELADVATSGSYDDLEDKPNLDASDNNTDISGLATVATTGSFDDLDNQYYIFTPSNFVHKYDSINNSWSVLTGNDFNILYECGLLDGWIKNIDKLYDSQSEDKVSFINEIENLINQYNQHKNCYLKSSGDNYYLINHIVTHYSEVNTLLNLVIDCSPILSNNFHSTLSTSIIETDTDIQNISDNILLQFFISNITIDINKNILYSTYKRVFPLWRVDDSIQFNKYGAIGVSVSSKPNNKLTLITDSGQEGLFVQ